MRWRVGERSEAVKDADKDRRRIRIRRAREAMDERYDKQPVDGSLANKPVTQAEAVRLLGVSKTTVIGWLREGRIVGVANAGGRLQIIRDETGRIRVTPSIVDQDA